MNPRMRMGELTTNNFFRPYLSDNFPIKGLGKVNITVPNVDRTPVMNIESVKARIYG
jgi:hypothetical protein